MDVRTNFRMSKQNCNLGDGNWLIPDFVPDNVRHDNPHGLRAEALRFLEATATTPYFVSDVCESAEHKLEIFIAGAADRAAFAREFSRDFRFLQRTWVPQRNREMVERAEYAGRQVRPDLRAALNGAHL